MEAVEKQVRWRVEKFGTLSPTVFALETTKPRPRIKLGLRMLKDKSVRMRLLRVLHTSSSTLFMWMTTRNTRSWRACSRVSLLRRIRTVGSLAFTRMLLRSHGNLMNQCRLDSLMRVRCTIYRDTDFGFDPQNATQYTHDTVF